MDFAPTGPRVCLWAPDEHTHPPLSREPVERLIFPSASRRLTYRKDGQRGGAVKASALAINVIPVPVGIAVPIGAVGATRRTGNTLPSRRQRTSKDELSTNEVIVFGCGLMDSPHQLHQQRQAVRVSAYTEGLLVSG